MTALQQMVEQHLMVHSKYASMHPSFNRYRNIIHNHPNNDTRTTETNEPPNRDEERLRGHRQETTKA